MLKPTAAVTAGNFLSYRPAYSTAEAGTVAGFKIDLSSVGINTVGFDFGETTGLTTDLGVWNGTAAGCVGIQQKNVTNWTERTHGFVDVRNNATGYLFDTAVGSSHARTELTIFVNANAGQSGVVMQNGVHVYESDLRIKGNIAGTGIALSMLDTSLYSGSIQFGCEGDGGGTAYGLSGRGHQLQRRWCDPRQPGQPDQQRGRHLQVHGLHQRPRLLHCGIHHHMSLQLLSTNDQALRPRSAIG